MKKCLYTCRIFLISIIVLTVLVQPNAFSQDTTSENESEPLFNNPEQDYEDQFDNQSTAIESTQNVDDNSFISFVPNENNSESGFQNAVIEGVQLTAEQGSQPDEKIVTGYFIFRDKPTSYFYEVKLKEKKLVFEFNDTRVGSSPVPTASESPIKGFFIEQGKIDINKSVKGLRPEWHDLIRVVFDMEAVPIVHVNDEYSIISFSFKWSSDPEKQAKYIQKDQTPKVVLWSTASVGGIALGVVTYLFLKHDDEKEKIEPLSDKDLPKRIINPQ